MTCGALCPPVALCTPPHPIPAPCTCPAPAPCCLRPPPAPHHAAPSHVCTTNPAAASLTYTCIPLPTPYIASSILHPVLVPTPSICPPVQTCTLRTTWVSCTCTVLPIHILYVHPTSPSAPKPHTPLQHPHFQLCIPHIPSVRLHMASPLQPTSVSCTPAHREGTAFQNDGIWPFLHFEHTAMGLGWAEAVLGDASPVLWAHLDVWVPTGAEGTCSAVSSGSSLMPESCSLLSASSSSSSFSQSCRRHKLGGPGGTTDTAWCRHRHRHGPHSSWGELPGSHSSGDALPAGSALGRYWMETTDGEMLDGEVGQGDIGWETLDQGVGWRRCLRRC